MKSLGSIQHVGMGEKEIKELLAIMDLVGNSDIAKILNWSASKVTNYHKRGVLPAPIAYIGGRPVWAKIQIEKYIKGVRE